MSDIMREYLIESPKERTIHFRPKNRSMIKSAAFQVLEWLKNHVKWG